jgi:hypothetical protein
MALEKPFASKGQLIDEVVNSELLRFLKDSSYLD